MPSAFLGLFQVETSFRWCSVCHSDDHGWSTNPRIGWMEHLQEPVLPLKDTWFPVTSEVRFSVFLSRFFCLRKVEAKKIKNMIRVGHLAAGAIAGELAMLGISQTRSVSRTMTEEDPGPNAEEFIYLKILKMFRSPVRVGLAPHFGSNQMHPFLICEQPSIFLMSIFWLSP